MFVFWGDQGIPFSPVSGQFPATLIRIKRGSSLFLEKMIQQQSPA